MEDDWLEECGAGNSDCLYGFYISNDTVITFNDSDSSGGMELIAASLISVLCYEFC